MHSSFKLVHLSLLAIAILFEPVVAPVGNGGRGSRSRPLQQDDSEDEQRTFRLSSLLGIKRSSTDPYRSDQM